MLLSALRKFFPCGVAIVGALFGTSASADVNLVTNGSFENINGATTNFFVNYPTANLPGWSGAGVGNDCIVLAASSNLHMCGQSSYIYDLDVSPGDSPDGGNYFMMDGDYVDGVHSEMYQTLTGLTIGDDYQLTFYQAAGQLYPFDTASNNAWYVQFGDQYRYAATMATPAAGIHPWESQTMNFVADSTSAVLGFLAIGGPYNVPPISFLDGVSVTDQGSATLPEPSMIAPLLAGILGLAAARRYVRKKGNAGGNQKS